MRVLWNAGRINRYIGNIKEQMETVGRRGRREERCGNREGRKEWDKGGKDAGLVGPRSVQLWEDFYQLFFYLFTYIIFYFILFFSPTQ